jgi:Raf kinase inhibitor-like YbhB/YbcL family protein
MQLKSKSFENNSRIPGRCAFGIPDADKHMQFGGNRNPQLSWSGVPENARSLVLLCIDPDVPSSADDVNQEGRSIPVDLPRVDFTHWAMVDVEAKDGSIDEGQCSEGVVAGGKDAPTGPGKSRQGVNDYTGFMAGDADMAGEYLGYDGPCPPWNDERLHHYHFILYATDLETCPVPDRFTGDDVKRAIESHILAEARLIGTYSLNPEVR